MTVLGKGGAGKLLAMANSVAVTVVCGANAVTPDVDAHGYLTLGSSGSINLLMAAEGTSTLF